MKDSNALDGLSRVRTEHRALALLRTLSATPGYRSNELILSDVLDRFGIVSTREEVLACLRNLDDLAAVTTDMEGGLMVVQLTARGGDIANGQVVVEGIARPGPECPY